MVDINHRQNTILYSVCYTEYVLTTYMFMFIENFMQTYIPNMYMFIYVCLLNCVLYSLLT